MVRTLFILMALAGVAGADDASPDLNSERDALVQRIIRGQDREGAARRFGELWRLHLARKQERVNLEKQAAEFPKTPDGLVLDTCALAADPRKPPETEEQLGKADWGPVIAKRMIPNPKQNPLSPAGTAGYEIAGQAGLHLVPVEAANPPAGGWPKLKAEIGDWVLVCERPGHAAAGLKISGPPAIARKARWNPIHMPPGSFHWAIVKNNWYYPPDRFVLTRVTVERDLGGGKLLITNAWESRWVLEVPAGLGNRQLLAPGRSAWVIAGQPRRDADKLLLTAVDVEERYLP